MYTETWLLFTNTNLSNHLQTGCDTCLFVIIASAAKLDPEGVQLAKQAYSQHVYMCEKWRKTTNSNCQILVQRIWKTWWTDERILDVRFGLTECISQGNLFSSLIGQKYGLLPRWWPSCAHERTLGCFRDYNAECPTFAVAHIYFFRDLLVPVSMWRFPCQIVWIWWNINNINGSKELYMFCCRNSGRFRSRPCFINLLNQNCHICKF